MLPVDAGFSEHAALAIPVNRVLAVGSNEAVSSTAGREGARWAFWDVSFGHSPATRTVAA